MKKSISFLLALTCILSASACTSPAPANSQDTPSAAQSDTQTAENGDAVELMWLAVGTEEEFTKPGNVSYEILDAFHKSQDKIHVSYEYYPNQNDLFEIIQVKIAGGTDEYDVLSVDSPMVSSYAYHNWLLPLDEYFSEEELADFTDTALENASYNGKLYAPALQNSSQVMCYNTALLEQAGVTIPDNDVNNRLTWDEVADLAAQTLEKVDPDGSKSITGIAFQQVSRTYQMNLLPNSMGGAQIGDDGFTVEGVLNSEPWINALTWYQNQVNEGICSRGIDAMEANDNFYNDKSVFFIATVGSISTIEKKMDHFDYTCVPAFEGYEDKVGTPCGGWNIGVNVNSSHPAEAAEFVKYTTLGEGNDIRFELSSHVPARRSLLESMVEDNTDIPKYLQIAAYEANNTAVLRANTPAFSEYCDVVDSLWEDVRNGSDIASSVENAIASIDSATAQYK